MTDLPTELVVQILNQVPNGKENKVRSLSQTSRHFKLNGDIHATTERKAKASQLMDRASKIDAIIYPREIAAFIDYNSTNSARLTEFLSILDNAKDPAIPLRGKNFDDVILALAPEISTLGPSATLGYDRMLEVLSSLKDDTTKESLIDTLSRMAMTFTVLNNEKQGECFDKLLTALESIENPVALNKAIASMPLSFLYRWNAEALGPARQGYRTKTC